MEELRSATGQCLSFLENDFHGSHTARVWNMTQRSCYRSEEHERPPSHTSVSLNDVSVGKRNATPDLSSARTGSALRDNGALKLSRGHRERNSRQ